MSKPLRIAGLDPGKRKDSFAMVATEVADNEIRMKGVKLWLHRKYIEVENEIRKIQDSKPFDFWVLEINNTGEHVFEALVYQRRMTNIIPVFTSRELKDQVKIAAGKVMSKNEIVRFCLKLSQNSREGKKPCITFPKNPSRYQDEARTVAERYIPKTNSYIAMVSTPNLPGGLFQRMEDEYELLSEKDKEDFYVMKHLDYTVGLNKVFNPENIRVAKLSPSFGREYQLMYGMGLGDVYENIDNIIQEYDLNIIGGRSSLIRNIYNRTWHSRRNRYNIRNTHWTNRFRRL